MPVKSAKNRTNKIKTILLVLGVVVAILLTFYADMFAASESSFYQHLVLPMDNPVAENTSSSKIINSSSYHSAARLFKIFTENLPFLNNK